MPSCSTCGHDHDHERGENCGVCGRCPPPPSASSSSSAIVRSPLPQQILSPYLFLGSLDDICSFHDMETPRPFKITRFLSVDPRLYVDAGDLGIHFHALFFSNNDIYTQFDEAFEYIRQCERDGATVLVYCSSGNGMSAAVVIAYLMRLRSWPLREALGWLSHRRPQIDITPYLMQQLEKYEKKIFPNGTTNGDVKHD